MQIIKGKQGCRGLKSFIHEFAKQNALMSVADVHSATGVPKDSIHAAIRSLVNEGTLIRCGVHSAKSRRFTLSQEVADRYEAQMAPKPMTKESFRRKLGACLGGLRTIEDLKARVEVDPDTGCWVWQGAVTRGFKGHAHGLPSAQIVGADGRRTSTSVQRWSFLQREGKRELEPGYIVWAARDCCRSCVNPEHMRAGTRKQWGQMIRATKRWKGLPTYKASAKRIGALRAIVTNEEIARIRLSGERHEDAAKRLGVSVKTIYRRLASTELVAGSSVFNYRPAANDGKKRAA